MFLEFCYFLGFLFGFLKVSPSFLLFLCFCVFFTLLLYFNKTRTSLCVLLTAAVLLTVSTPRIREHYTKCTYNRIYSAQTNGHIEFLAIAHCFYLQFNRWQAEAQDASSLVSIYATLCALITSSSQTRVTFANFFTFTVTISTYHLASLS